MAMIDRDELLKRLGISERFNADVPAWVIDVIKGMPDPERTEDAKMEVEHEIY